MNVLVVAPPAFPVSLQTGNSVEITLLQIARRISKLQNVTILSRGGKGLSPQTKRGNLTIVRFPSRNNYIKQVLSYAENKEYDLIQVENRPLSILPLRKKFPKTKIILVLHSLTFMKRIAPKKQWEIIKKSDGILCNSEFIRQEYIKRFPRLAQKFHTIYLGVDLPRFHPPSKIEKQMIREKYKLSHSFNILNAGRIIPGKGIHLLVKAVGTLKKKYPYIKLILVGPCRNQNYRSYLQEEAQKADIELTFLGPVKASEMHMIYWLGDCFVLPTQFLEAFGLVNIEAMASGIPVIASNRGGIPEIIQNDHGILVDEYQNEHAFSQAIENILQHPSLAHKKVEKALERAANFCWEKVAERYHAFYEQLINM